MSVGLLTTEAAAAVSRALNLTPALSSRTAESYVRGWPSDVVPPVEGGKRRWKPEHVERLRLEVAARMGVTL